MKTKLLLPFLCCTLLLACGPSGNDAAETESQTGTPRSEPSAASGNPQSDPDLNSVNQTNSMGNDTSGESIDTPHTPTGGQH